jgi:hypothetical protein
MGRRKSRPYRRADAMATISSPTPCRRRSGRSWPATGWATQLAQRQLIVARLRDALVVSEQILVGIDGLCRSRRWYCPVTARRRSSLSSISRPVTSRERTRQAAIQPSHTNRRFSGKSVSNDSIHFYEPADDDPPLMQGRRSQSSLSGDTQRRQHVSIRRATLRRAGTPIAISRRRHAGVSLLLYNFQRH